MKCKKKQETVEATQWFKVGDHSVVEKYPCPYGDGNEFCQYCNSPMHTHGTIGTLLVCPGSWIVTDDLDNIAVCDPRDFEAMYDTK